ncbi:MAG: cytochrome c-type biogenesis protein [Gammaproteobacteria bacterium]|nr:cytochrome c-type biogenesis protein [Gammaproteobacteria bacterium]
MMRSLMLVLLLAMPTAFAAENRFEDPQKQERYTQLINELRCLVCQNQTIADSNADLANDLKDKVAGMIHDGKSNEEIIIFLTDRYGDFVLYRPPVQPNTWLLWAGPALLLGAGLLVFGFTLRRRAANADREEITDNGENT